MRFKIIVVVFLLFCASNLATSYLSNYFVPYLGFFPYKEIAIKYNLPKLVTAFANFDGAHYLLIAKNGYTTYQQAFFPLYPLLIRWFSLIFSNNFLLTGLIISNASFLFGLWIFAKYLNVILASEERARPESNNDSGQAGMTTKNQTIWPIIFLLAFPSSFFFGAVYTEGLFFLLFASILYFLKKNKYFLAGIFALFAALTKFIGVFLIIFFVLKLIKPRFNREKIKNFNLLIATLFPIVGLGIYSFYLWQSFGDPLFFLNSQWAFGANRSSTIIFLPQVYYRYINIFFTANFNFQYFIALFEFLTFNFVFIVVILNLFQDLKLSFWGAKRLQNRSKQRFQANWNDKVGLGLFSLINVLLPTLTGTFSSIPRYALFSLSFFIYLSQIKNFSIKLGLAIIFAILHIIFFSFFIQGYFVS